MKTDTLVIIGAAGVGLWLVAQMTRAPRVVVPAPRPYAPAGSLNNYGNLPSPGVFHGPPTETRSPNGWRYFSDGMAIAPDGTVYQNGVRAW